MMPHENRNVSKCLIQSREQTLYEVNRFIETNPMEKFVYAVVHGDNFALFSKKMADAKKHLFSSLESFKDMLVKLDSMRET